MKRGRPYKGIETVVISFRVPIQFKEKLKQYFKQFKKQNYE